MSKFTLASLLVSLALCGNTWSQTADEVETMLRSQGARPQPGETWILVVQGEQPALYPDRVLVVKGGQGVVASFRGTHGVEPGGIRPAGALPVVDPDQAQDFAPWVQEGPPRYCLLPAGWQPPAPQPEPELGWLAPRSWNREQRFNHYQRLLLRYRGKAPEKSPVVLALRGRAPDGTPHPASLNQGGYDDTFIVLRRDSRGAPRVEEFPGSTHAGNPKDPDVPAPGVAQIRAGLYRAKPAGHHHGWPCWELLTAKGQRLIPCWRDADRDGHIAEHERHSHHRASDILVHHGLYRERASSIGCLTLPPEHYAAFVQAVGSSNPFELCLIDAEGQPPQQPLTYPLGRSVQGQPVVMHELGHGPRVALYFATIHGDEPAGTDLLLRLKAYLQEHPEHLEGWTVRLIPRVNVDSCRRTNARGVDLNRNFPALWNRHSGQGEEYPGPEALSEPEARCLRRAVEGLAPGPAGRPCRIVSIHQHKGLPAGSGVLDGDGPESVQSLVQALLKTAPVGWSSRKVADSQGRTRIPGSFGTWVSHPSVSIPTITLEISHHDRQPEVNWQRYQSMLLHFLAQP